MSTHATTTFIENGATLATLYTHWDGDTFDQALKAALSKYTITSGLSNKPNHANGISELALYAIKELKTEPGNLYLIVPGIREFFHYEIREKNAKVHLTSYEGEIQTYKGLIEEYK